MGMIVTQVRLPQGIVDEVDRMVERGLYTNKSDVVRDALRRLILEKQIRTIEGKKDSVKEIREIRKKLPKEKINLLGSSF